MSSGFTTVQYGDVIISDAQTLMFEQTFEKEGAGDTVYIRYTVRVQGYLLAQPVAGTQILPNKGPLPGSGNYEQTAASQHVQLRGLLSAPRKKFKMTLGVGGTAPTVLLEANPVSGNTQDMSDPKVDMAGGPMPKVLAIQNVASNQAIKVTWECMVCLREECSEYGSGGNVQRSKGILHNRFTCAETYNESYYATRTFRGELRLSNPLINPHDFRSVVVLPLQPGFMIKHMEFAADETGLRLQYTVTHEAVTYTPPYPATSIKIYHKIVANEFALEISESLGITMTCDQLTDRRQLLLIASWIADGKIRKSMILPEGKISASHRLIEQTMVDESGSDQQTRVTVNYQIRHFPMADGEDDALPGQQPGDTKKFLIRSFGLNPNGQMIANYDPSLSTGNRPGERPPYKGPLSVVGAFACKLTSACTLDHSSNRGIQASDGDSVLIDSTAPIPNLPSVPVTITSDYRDLPDSTFSESHSVGMYQEYNIDNKIMEDRMILQAPLSSPISSGGSLSDLLNGGGTPTAPANPLPLANPTTGGSAASGDTSVFIQVGPPQWCRVVRIEAKRHRLPPRFPEPKPTFRDSSGVLHVLLNKAILPMNPEMLPDNTLMYSCRYEATYGMSKAPTNILFPEPDYAAQSSLGSPSPYLFPLSMIFGSDKSIG